jgi:nitrite reductase/ring-hydroxylating ferredoxin subunit
VWQSNRKVLNCPCHDVDFDAQGQALSAGYPFPALPFVKARVRSDGRVEVLGT